MTETKKKINLEEVAWPGGVGIKGPTWIATERPRKTPEGALLTQQSYGPQPGSPPLPARLIYH